MKRLIKSALFVAGLVAIPVAINYYIFDKAGEKQVSCVTKDKFYDWQHGKIRYISSGTGSPLLLVHGVSAGGSLYEWERVIHELSKTNTVYAIDLLGFGYSEKPKTTYSAYLYITLINDFIRDVIGEKVSIIASSNSGAYAVMAYNFKPENFEKMLLISPTGVGASNEYPTSRDVFVKWLIQSPIIGTSIYNFMTSKLYCKWFLQKYCYSSAFSVTDRIVDKYYYPAHYKGLGAKLSLAAFISNFLNVDIETKLEKIKIPFHVVWGTDCEINPAANFHFIKALKEDATITKFEGAKLLPHVENSKMFIKVVKDFLEGKTDEQLFN